MSPSLSIDVSTPKSTSRARTCLLGVMLTLAAHNPAEAVDRLPSGGNGGLPGEPPVIPIGLDAYRLWDRWPYQRIGARTYLRSTYDRTGGNHGADGGHFLYQTAEDFNVVLDVEGPGILSFVRYNHWHGSPWHYEVDGVDHLVGESATADPGRPVPNSVFLPEHLFPNPLTWTWSTSKGGDLMCVPIGFEKSFRMAYSRTFYGTGYFIYQRYVDGARLSRPLSRWDGKTPPGKDVLDLINRSGSDIAPQPGTAGVRQRAGEVTVPPKGQAVEAWVSKDGPAMVRFLEFSVPRERAVEFSDVRLRVTWDGRAEPSIDAPIALFHGAGTLFNRTNKEYLVKSFPVVVRYVNDRVVLQCYFPMPFFRSAKVELVGAGEEAISGVKWTVRYEPFKGRPNEVGYFHATYRDHPSPKPGREIMVLDTQATESGGDWSGQFVGTSMILGHEGKVMPMVEGDPRFFFDDSQTPQAQGTGTEEWSGGGDDWLRGELSTLPFLGHPVGVKPGTPALSEADKIHSAYRFLLADLMPFGKNARITFEHGGMNEVPSHYESVAYWYGLPAPSLIKTDELAVGDEASERAHQYHSPEASKPYELTSRFEWGVNHVRGEEIFPAHTDRGRTTRSASEFLIKTDPRNLGVLLRRKLDYLYPNQRAEVYVSDAKLKQPDWKFAGIWYLSGSTTVVFSRPSRDELAPTGHEVITSERRFREDEFLIPRALTQGRDSVRIRVKFTPVSRPLFPGYPIPELAWSEMRYHVYSFVMPRFPL